MQLVDELSMIYTTCLMNYATFSYGKSRRFSVVLAVSLLSLCLFITLYYHYLQEPTFHQVAYALLTASLLFRSFWVMEVNMRPRFRSDDQPFQNGFDRSGQAEQKREDRRDKKILKQMWSMIAIGLGIFVGGFAIWNLDNEFCPTLRRWRRQVGLPWGILLEGHGWWHVMTGIGAYYYIVWGIWLRHCLNDRQDEYELIWPSLMQMPAVVKRRKPLATDYQNGSAKKER
jgi:dihydroceramidase